MKDIAKCKNNSCPLKDTCRRFTEPAKSWQSWINGRVNFRMWTCEDYLEVKQ